MPNIEKVIKGHHQKQLTSDTKNKQKPGIVEKNENCPLNRQCLTDNAVY